MNSYTALTAVNKNTPIHRLMQVVIFCIILLSIAGSVSAKDWKTETTKDGRFTVQSRISKRIGDDGERVQLIEFTATTVHRVSMQQLIAVLKDVSKHKDFQDDKESRVLEILSDHEWLIYYYTDMPWPFSDSDCVAKMTFTQTGDMAEFVITAAPSMFEKQDVLRLTYYNMRYVFKQLGTGQVEITIAAQTSPAEPIPGWMLNASFPEAGTDAVRKIIDMAQEGVMPLTRP